MTDLVDAPSRSVSIVERISMEVAMEVWLTDEPFVPCESAHVQTKRCSVEATWRCTIPNCGHAINVCQKLKDKWDAQDWPEVVCPTCKNHYPTATWRPL